MRFIAVGNVLAKQSRDLSALSELMAALVKSQSQFAEGLRKTATDGTHGTQEFFEQFLATTRNQTDSQVAVLQQFLSETFLPKFQTVAKALQEQGQAVQQLQRAMTVCFSWRRFNVAILRRMIAIYRKSCSSRRI